MIIEDQAFSRLYNVASRPPHSPLPYPVSKLDSKTKRDSLMTGEGGRGWARSRIMRPQSNSVGDLLFGDVTLRGQSIRGPTSRTRRMK